MLAELPEQWRAALWLEHRPPDECVNKADKTEPGPYAGQLRDAFDLGISTVFCIDRIPAATILVLEENDSISNINKVHQALWNQGLADLLLVIQGEILRVFSLWKHPKPPRDIPDSKDNRLIEVLHLIDDALKISQLLPGLESGRLTQESQYKSSFDESSRIDTTLLQDLEATRKQIVETGLDLNTTHTLLLQTMFLAYLWDRKIIDADYLNQGKEEVFSNLVEMLQHKSMVPWSNLLYRLDRDLNAGMFLTKNSKSWRKSARHLATFLQGDFDIKRNQHRLFRLYQFDHIPVELLSEVYDRFLDTDEDRRLEGAYYTPRRLAAFVSDEAWNYLKQQKNNGNNPLVLDPACGSGIFLVALFHRMVSDWRAKRNGKKPDWSALKKIVESLHGIDKNPTAIQISAFSLSVAMLDEEEPRQIQNLMTQGKALPKLLGETLQEADFFKFNGYDKYSLVIGNPPWGKITSDEKIESEKWCIQNSFPVPDRELAWAFVWKSIKHLAIDGQLTLLLPIMRFIYNSKSTEALKRWIESGRLKRIIDLSDMREVLFKKSKVPACIVSYCNSRIEESYRIEHWCPKTDLNLMFTGRITITHGDINKIWSAQITEDPVVTFKTAMWASRAEARLISYLTELPSLSHFVKKSRDARKAFPDSRPEWGMGEGFGKITKADEKRNNLYELPEIKEMPFLPTDQLVPYTVGLVTNDPYETDIVSWKKYQEGFTAPHIIFSMGIDIDGPHAYRLKAAYSEQDICFEHSVTAITVPNTQIGKDCGKVITAVMNSQLSAWFLFHTSRLGVDRDRIVQDDVLRIPFPMPKYFSDSKKTQNIYRKIVKEMDDVLFQSTLSLPGKHEGFFPVIPDHLADDDTVNCLDQLVFEYFNLHKYEQEIIKETLNYVRPAIHPGKGIPAIWGKSEVKDWKKYCKTLRNALQAWMKTDYSIAVRVIGTSPDLVVVHASLDNNSGSQSQDFNKSIIEMLDSLLPQLRESLLKQLSRNVQLLRMLRIYQDDDLFLIKPRQLRFWLTSSARDDAEDIIADLIMENPPNQRFS
jgi:hypothetical protein